MVDGSRTLSVAYVAGPGVVGNQLRKAGSSNCSHGQRSDFSYYVLDMGVQPKGFIAYRR